MGRILAVNIAVSRPMGGSPVIFVAGQELPDWAADQVTNEAVFEPEVDLEVEVPPPAIAAVVLVDPQEVPADLAPGGVAGPGEVTVELPEGTVVKPQMVEDGRPQLPRPAVNDSKADWAAYAGSVGLDLPESATKPDIIAAVKDLQG